MRDFDDNDFPLAYLITFRCYGTWLHGDDRGSMDRKHNVYGTPKIASNQPLAIGNLILGLRTVCENYQGTFVPEVKSVVSKPPSRLRCGITRGRIISVGDGKDFVGPCINVASKIQKLEHLSFAFSRRGFDLETIFGERARRDYTLIKSSVPGLGDDELFFVLKNELAKLSAKDRQRLQP